MDAPWQVRDGAKNIILRNLKILHQRYGGFVGGVDDLQILGGEIGWIDPNDGLHFNNVGGENTQHRSSTACTCTT